MEDKKTFWGQIGSAFATLLPDSVTKKPQPKADWQGYRGQSYTPVYTFAYNGEKNVGEIGPVKAFYMDYEALRLRSWQAYLESEIAQTVIKKYILWMVGSGLRLKCEPNKIALQSEGVDIETEKFNEITEARFSVFASSRNSDYRGMRDLNYITKVCYMNAIVGGDVLVVQRYNKKTGMSVQLIDGSHIQSPMLGTEWWPQELPNGNCIKNGIEITPSGQHVNYYVRNRDNTFDIIPARGKNSDMLMAYMVYGLEYRLDNIRGIPLLSVVLEKIAKMDRYDEAVVGSAEERSKIAYTIKHDQNSTGESPLAKQITRTVSDTPGELPVDTLGNALADRIAATTNKMTFNMTPGSELVALSSDNELHFKEFFTTHIDLICAAIGIPPNVAMSSYNDSFSASRAATKDWEHTLKVGRSDLASQLHRNIYNFWLDIEILTNKIDAPGYLQAIKENNYMVLEAYRNARFTGDMFPHIDPVKEATAMRLLLGEKGANLPMATLELVTELLGTGESDGNVRQFMEELNEGESLGLEIPVTNAPADPSLTGNNQKK